MSAASAWTDSTIGAVSRMNLTGVISGTGTYLATLDWSKYKLLVCTADGDIFVQNHTYLCNADGISVTDLSVLSAHYHSSSSDGGFLTKVFSTSPEMVDTGTQFLFHIKKADWVESVSGTGSTADVTSGVNFDNQTVTKAASGGTNASTADLTLNGLIQDFTKPSYFAMITAVSSTSSVAGHWGFSIERMQDADDNVRKYGAAICTATNGNWFIRSADGSAHSDSDTGTAFTTSDTSIVVVHNAELGTPSIVMSVNGTVVLTKTTNVPTGSTGLSRANLWRYGVKNSTGSDRNIHLKKLRLGYWINDASFSA